jgi:hypothetical protein
MSRFASPAPLLAVIGAAGLGVVTAVLPILGDRHVTLPKHVLAFVLVLLPVSLLIYGILVIGADSAVWKLLFWGMTAGALGAAAAYFGGRPEELAGSTTTLPLMLLFLADALRIAAATYAGLVLARPFASSGIALLAAGLVAAGEALQCLCRTHKNPRREWIPLPRLLSPVVPNFRAPSWVQPRSLGLRLLSGVHCYGPPA